jgi:4-carboxymuconolactone decarboxylase
MKKDSHMNVTRLNPTHLTRHHRILWLIGVFFGACLMSTIPAHAQPDAESLRRFKLLQPEQLTEAQKQLAQNIRSGPRAGVAGSAANNTVLGSPFNVFLRSPEVGEPLQQVGSYIRFKSSLGAKLNEFAILITARHWGAQYEWHAHHRLALQAGLSPSIADDVAHHRKPQGMSVEEEAIYNFSHELHTQKQVSDATYKAVLDRFGEQGVMDLIAVNGYYTLVAMVLNVDRTPVPGGALPLK